MQTPESEKASTSQQHPAPPLWWKTKLAQNTGWVFLILAILGLAIWFFAFRPYVSTDDARVGEDLIQIAPDNVGGTITQINVHEGDRVTLGELLMELDHTDYQAQLQKAQAQQIVAQADLARTQKLYRHSAISTQAYENAQATAQEAQANLQLAQTALDRTYLKSPVDGLVVKKIAVIGNLLEPGQVALIIANVDQAWIAANIEETSVGSVKIGQPVQINIDEGGHLTGHVSEITAATASQFALLPAENASGNYIKLVERIPIKIALDPHPGQILRDGQSVEIKIKVK